MNILNYFEPIKLKSIKQKNKEQLSNFFLVNDGEISEEDINDKKIAIIGIPEERNSYNIGCKHAPDKIRIELYSLFCNWNNKKKKIIDLGNLKIGKTHKDTYFAIKKVVSSLMKKGIITVLLGGSHDLCYGNFIAFEELEQSVNIAVIDQKIDFTGEDKDINENNFLNSIIFNDKKILFNIANIGYQTQLTDKSKYQLLQKFFYDNIRLGVLRQNIVEVEAVLRDTDILSIDINSIKQSEAPASPQCSPNGLTSEEICQIAKYAGVSDKLSCFGLYGVNPKLDFNNITSKLAAQIIWFFIDGVFNRQNDYPFTNVKNYQQFFVSIDDVKDDFIFYKNPKNNRWWIQIPYKKSMIMACSKENYEKAANGEIPDRIFNAMKKLGI